MATSKVPRDFQVVVDREVCRRCQRCVRGCGFDALVFEGCVDEHPTNPCVACGYCMAVCPEGAITVTETTMAYRPHGAWTPSLRRSTLKQALTGGVLLTGMGNELDYELIFDHLLLDACQVTNPSIDPLREPMELRTYLGRKPDRVEVARDQSGRPQLKTEIGPQVTLETPITFSPMSYGSISLNAQKSLAMAAKECGIMWATGEGGLHKDLYEYAEWACVQVASGRFGVHTDYLQRAAAIEIKIGQGAKPG
ncbi:MAG: glutamate synthase-related protein, partial [Armatimonadota bacterium]